MLGKRVLMLAGLAVVAIAAAGIVILRGDSPDASPGQTEEAAVAEDLAGNLLAREAAGDWTRGEGLVATLKLFTGEIALEEVVPEGEVEHRGGYGVLRMAREYLASGESDHRAEVEDLLDRATFDEDELKAMAGEKAVGLGRSVAARPNLETDCGEFVGDQNWTYPCVEVMRFDAGGFTHEMYRPVDGANQGGWTVAHYDAVRAVVNETVPAYQQVGKMMPLRIIFLNFKDGSPSAAAYPVYGQPCVITLYTTLQESEAGLFLQTIAHEIAHCFQTETFPQQNEVPYPAVKWREEGMAEYLTNLVDPTSNFEWYLLKNLTGAKEHNTGIFDRSYVNFAFFQFLKNELGLDGLFNLIRSLPTSGGTEDQVQALAAWPNMDELFHKFAQQWYDGAIADDGGGHITTPTSTPTKTLTSSETIANEAVKPFMARRRDVTLPRGKEAGMQLNVQGEPRSSVQLLPGAGWAELGGWNVPGDRCYQDAHFVTLVTATIPGAEYDLSGLVENADCEKAEAPDDLARCLVGRWSLDMSTFEKELMRGAPADFSLVYKEGGIWATFAKGGSVEFEIDYEATQHQAMTDSGGNDMGILHGGRFSGSGSNQWTAEGEHVAFGDGTFNVTLQFATSIKGKTTYGAPIDVSKGYSAGGLSGTKRVTCTRSELTVHDGGTTYTWDRD